MVAALVFIASAAAGASAAKLPEFGACEAVPSHEGKYADANCMLPVKKVYGKYTGGYEWYTWEQALGGRGLNEYGSSTVRSVLRRSKRPTARRSSVVKENCMC